MKLCLLLRPVGLRREHTVQEFLRNWLASSLLWGYACCVHQGLPLVLIHQSVLR